MRGQLNRHGRPSNKFRLLNSDMNPALLRSGAGVPRRFGWDAANVRLFRLCSVEFVQHESATQGTLIVQFGWLNKKIIPMLQVGRPGADASP
jgi:hypothetical protein